MKLKYIQNVLTGFFSVIFFISTYAQSQPVKNETGLYQKIINLQGVDSVIKLPVENHYKEKYEIYFKQLLNPNDSSAGFFNQRIFLSHTDYTQPVVFITEGYNADYGESKYYSNELSDILHGNQILAEHRYFGKSWPDSIDWTYLTVEYAAHDHHEIINTFKAIYEGKWISTGISKGGQTTLIHMSLYPEDVDFSVPYVAPLNFGIEDGRHEPYIENISTPYDRKRVIDFQKAILEKRDSIFPMFENYCRRMNYSFRIPLEEIYDYCVLEYSFAFWQWGYGVSLIPDKDASSQVLFSHFVMVSSPSYFAVEDIEPLKAFFVQAWHQMGYYGYDTEPFKGLLKIENAEDYLQKIFLSKDVKLEYDKESMIRVQRFLEENDPKMLFIYGEFDPWSATAVKFTGKKNMKKIVKPMGSHSTRIHNLPPNQKESVNKILKQWMNE